MNSLSERPKSQGLVASRGNPSRKLALLKVFSHKGFERNRRFWFKCPRWTYYRARYFDPAPGTFVSADPLGFRAGDANLYRYVFNSPTNFTDPSGMFVPLVPLLFYGGVAATTIATVVLADLLFPDGVQAPGICEPLVPNLDRSNQRAVAEIILSMGLNSTPGIARAIGSYGDELFRIAGSSIDDIFRGLAGDAIPVPVGPSLSNVADDAIGSLVGNGSLIGNRGAQQGLGAAADDIAQPFLSSNKSDDGIPEIIIDASKYPESAQHARDAQSAGKPLELTINRSGSKPNRKDSLKGKPRVKGKDRDEYPPAMFQEGGSGASVRPIDPSDNRGAGSSMGHQARPYPDGTVVRIVVKD